MGNKNNMYIKVLVNFITLHLCLPINRCLSREIVVDTAHLSDFRDSIPLTGLAGVCRPLVVIARCYRFAG
jgi:hypothetical protein